jgi:IS5 family transposase
LLLGTSVKQALDVEWSDPPQKTAALNRLVEQVASLQRWIARQLTAEQRQPPLQAHVATLAQVLGQDLEPDPTGGVRIREGVAEDRRVSVEDAEMRHGRKSKTKRFNGYKRHLATDLDSDLILAAAITPANRPEAEAVPALQADLARQGLVLGELHIDRAYINSPVVDEVLGIGGLVRCKPWVPRARRPGAFTKAAFTINARAMTLTCPAGETERFRPGQVVEFDPEACEHCAQRARCTMAAPGTGRTVAMAANELLQVRLRREMATPRGRARLRARVAVEHRLAHLVRRQGRRARYRGVRKNTFDVRRAAALQNLETIQRTAPLGTMVAAA